MCRIYGGKHPFVRLCYRTKRRGERVYPPEGKGKDWLERHWDKIAPRGHILRSSLRSNMIFL